MKTLFAALGCLAAFLSIGFAVDAYQRYDEQVGDKIHILFVGNSFTYYHDMPKMVAELAKNGKQRRIHVEQVAPPGCTFEKHWHDGEVTARLESRHWDFVVLQEQSQGPLRGLSAMQMYASKLDAEIKKNGAKTIFYMTWARRGFPDDQAVITRSYTKLAKQLEGQVAPVGQAFEAVAKANSKFLLREPDNLHPNPAGSYLAACVFYATIYGKSPVGLSGRIAGLSEAEAGFLQSIAWRSVHEHTFPHLN